MSVGDQQHIVVAPDCIDTKIDVGVLKQQITTLTLLCDKMDKVIEKLVDQHDRHIAKGI